MDWLKLRSQISERLNQYKYVVLVVALGIFLMVLPSQSEPEQEVPATVAVQTRDTTEEKLEQILGQIRDVGKVTVMLTEQTGSETVYQVDEDRDEGEGSLSIRKETVVLSSDGVQSGLVQTVSPPTYLGAIVVCQGAGSPSVKLAVANAVSAVTGISVDRISVLEMK